MYEQGEDMLTINDLLEAKDTFTPELDGVLDAIGRTLDMEFKEGLDNDGYLTKYGDMRILVQAENNNDVNGFQTGSNQTICFGYDDAELYDAVHGRSVGYYDSFVERDDWEGHEDDGMYSGNQYEGDNMFGALVIDPPAYTYQIRY
jgi:hypothetical protein